MNESIVETGKPLTSKTVWTWVIIATAVPFIMFATIIFLMIALDFNILNWME